MKIKINYDLVEKINESENGVKLSKTIKEFYKKPLVFGTTSLQVFSILGMFFRSNPGKISPISLLAIGIHGLTHLVFLYSSYMKNNLDKDYDIQKARYDLYILVSELNNLDVNTTYANLLKSEVIQTDYEFKFVDSKPLLKQKKYINIPLNNGYEQTIMQEHKVGSKEYELSVNEPEKKMNLKLSRNAI
ncbi:MAG: hypothetical protein IJ094_01075 [Bacilli bacterium]|nr:hypothetical protein [Bacilli bacterium]